LQKSIHYDNYPKQVSEVTEKIIETLEEDNFFRKENISPDITFKNFADNILQKWISGNVMDIFADDEFFDVLKMCMVESDVTSLKDRGFIDFIEDESGNPLYFLTEMGKQAVKESN